MILVIFVNFWAVQGDWVIEFMYVKRMFQWKMDIYSYFSTVANAISNVGTLISLPIFHYFNASDNSIILISGLSGILIRLCKGLVKSEEGFFAATFFGLLGNVFYSPVRAQITRCVSSNELGKVENLHNIKCQTKVLLKRLTQCLGFCHDVQFPVSCPNHGHCPVHQPLQCHS